MQAFVFGKVIDWTIKFVNEGGDEKYIYYSLLAYGTYYLVNSIAGVLSNYGNNLSGFKIGYEIPERLLHEKLNTLSTAALENPEVQNLIYRYRENRHDFENLSDKMFISLSLIISFLIAFIPLFRLLPVVTILLIASAIPAYFMNRYAINKLWELSKSTTVDSRRSGNLVYSISNPESLKEIRIIGAYNYIKSYFDRYIERYFGSKINIYRKWSIMDVLSSALMGAVILLGIYQLINLSKSEVITIGQISFYLTALVSMGGYIDTFSANFTDWIASNMRLTEMLELLNYDEKLTPATVKINKLQNPPLLKLENVNFAYPGSEKNVIEDLNLEIKPGEKIAIVGENGAGKTTLVKLISNIYPVTSGTIKVDGQDLNTIDQRSWFENIGVLYQDFNKYSDLTAFENIALGRMPELPHPSLSLQGEGLGGVVDAAKKADAYEFIQEYKDNFSQVLSERYEGGIRPSTGQWQKIAIARFFYRNSPILILDEPTAAIDAVSEANIFDRIYEFIEGKTVIIISHRFSTVRKADRIIVFDKGKIIEQGTHEELMMLDGKYKHAFSTQAKGYQS